MTTRRRPKRPAHDLPDWIPIGVKDAARHLPPSDVAQRLLADPRMERVWRVLLRQAADREAVERRLLFADHLPTTWGQEFSPQQRACAALFVDVVENLTRAAKIVKRADTDARAKPYFDAAKVCRAMIEDAERYERGYEEAGEVLDFDLRRALKVVADILECEAKRASAIDQPRVIERSAKSPGEDELRVKARMVGATMFSIYGKRNTAIVATIMSVATGAAVLQKSIENWCADIPQ